MPKRIRLGTVTNGTLDSTDATIEIDGDDLYITVENGDVRTDGTVAFEDATADPSANGELQRNGADIKAYSGGAVRSLSNIGGGLWETVTGAIRPDTADTDVIPNGDSSLGTSSDPWPAVTAGQIGNGGSPVNVEDDLDATGHSVKSASIQVSESGVEDFGTVTAGSFAGVEVTFQTSHTTAPAVVAMTGFTGNPPDAQYECVAKEVDTNGFTLAIVNESGSDITMDHVSWLAITQ